MNELHNHPPEEYEDSPAYWSWADGREPYQQHHYGMFASQHGVPDYQAMANWLRNYPTNRPAPTKAQVESLFKRIMRRVFGQKSQP